MLKKNSFLFIIYSLLALLVFGCIFGKDKQAGSGTETGNVEGTIQTAQGSPAPDATVNLYQKVTNLDSIQAAPVALKTTSTDDEGRFNFDLEEGEYTIIASKGSQSAFIDSISVAESKIKGLEGTLLPPGHLAGTILNTTELKGATSVVVHLLGTRFFQNVLKDGTFSIRNIPAGTYTFVAYSTQQAEFSPLYRTVVIHPDSVTSLGELLLPFNGIPIPQNIQLHYDSINGVVQLAWDPIDFEDFQEFIILRGPANTPVSNLKPIGRTKENHYSDKIDFGNSSKLAFEYRVLIRDKFGDQGKSYGDYIIEVTAPVDFSYNPNGQGFLVTRNKRIFAGYRYSGFLKNDGTITMWGGQESGETNVPQGLSDVASVSGGIFNSLVLKKDSTLVAWGRNDHGQSNVPNTFTDVIATEAGTSHGIALRKNGTIFMWGDNRRSQLEIPLNLSKVVDVSSGVAHTIALRNDSSIVVWGDNGYDFETHWGPLANSVNKHPPSELRKAIGIGTGYFHSLAIRPDSTVIAWGWNDDGQTNVPNNLKSVITVSGGLQHSIALKSDGTVVAWGNNSFGQLNIPEGLNNVVDITASHYHNLALREDGTVVAWGWNNDGQTDVPINFRWSGDPKNQGDTPSDHIVSHWHMNEGVGTKVHDLYKNGNDGTRKGNPTWTSQGAIGGALEFDGIDDEVYIAYDPSLNLSEYTLSAWFKTSHHTNEYQAILSRFISGIPFKANYEVLIGGTPLPENPDQKVGVLYTQISNQWAYDVGEKHYGNTVVTDGKWHHVAVTQKGKESKIYLDGRLESTKIFSAFPPTDHDSPLTIGANQLNTGALRFKGTLDEIKIFNKALSLVDVQELANDGPELTPVGSFQHHWDFSTISNNTTYDLVSNHPAVLHGTVEQVDASNGKGVSIDWVTDWISFGNFFPKIVDEGAIEVTFKINEKKSEPMAIFGSWSSRFLLYIAGDSIVYAKGLSDRVPHLIAEKKLNTGSFYTLKGTWGSNGMQLFLDNQLIASNEDNSFYGAHYSPADSAWLNRFHAGSLEPWEFFVGRKNGCCLDHIGLPHLYNKFYGFDGVIDEIKVWGK